MPFGPAATGSLADGGSGRRQIEVSAAISGAPGWAADGAARAGSGIASLVWLRWALSAARWYPSNSEMNPSSE
jgi:hypothetical protein